MASDSNEKIALLSIHPKFADLIMEGTKKVEFRKSRFRNGLSHVVVYATSPVQKILGYFEVSHIEEGSPHDLWARYGTVGGASREEFQDYYRSADQGIAIGIGKVSVLKKPMPMSALHGRTTPPQSFMYLNSKTFTLIHRNA